MDADWLNLPSQSSSSICKTAAKARKSKAKRHSVYSESDDEEACEISDCDEEEGFDEEEDDCYLPKRRDHNLERSGSCSLYEHIECAASWLILTSPFHKYIGHIYCHC